MGSVFLEVGIGLAVVFVLIATVVDGVNEVVTRMLNTRAKSLWATLEGMLQEQPADRPEIGFSFIFRSSLPGRVGGDDHRPNAQASGKGTPETTELLGAPSIRALDYVRDDVRRTKIWRIGGETFAAAIREIARTKASDDQDTLKAQIENLAKEWKGTPLGDYLAGLAIDSAESADQFLDTVSGWFDEQMERLRLTYRRNVKWVLGIVGLLAALLLNIDSINIASALRDDAQLRTAVTALSGDLDENDLIFEDCELPDAKEGEQAADKRLLCALDDISTLQEVGMPVLAEDWTWRTPWTEEAWGDSPLDWLSHLAGLLLTAGAVSLGGVFWWDFLRFISGFRQNAATTARRS